MSDKIDFSRVVTSEMDGGIEPDGPDLYAVRWSDGELWLYPSEAYARDSLAAVTEDESMGLTAVTLLKVTIEEVSL